MKATVLAICTILLVGQLSALPNTSFKAGTAVSTYQPGNDLAEADYYRKLVDDFSWKSLLEHVPDFIFPVLEKILKGIARSKSPKEIIKAILTGKFDKKKKRRRRKKKGEKNKGEEPEPETEPENQSNP